jgi:hypothetical protein
LRCNVRGEVVGGTAYGGQGGEPGEPFVLFLGLLVTGNQRACDRVC